MTRMVTKTTDYEEVAGEASRLLIRVYQWQNIEDPDGNMTPEDLVKRFVENAEGATE